MPLIRIGAIDGRMKDRGVDVTTESPVAAVATTDPNAKTRPGILLGLTMGLLAAAIGALYSVYATDGLARGLKSADMTCFEQALRAY